MRLSLLLLATMGVLSCIAHPVSEPAVETTTDDSNEKSTSEEAEKSTSDKAVLAFHKNTKIAVIGGGPAGLFAARQLTRAGYRKVTVFETANNGPRLVKTQQVDGHYVDFTTRYLPNANPEGPGLYAPLQEMITEYGLDTVFTSAPITYVDVSSSSPVALPMPHIFGDFFAPGGAGPSAIVSQLIWGFEVLRVVHAAPGVVGCYSAIGVPAGTSFGAWATAVNKPAFTRLAAFTSDLFLGGPSPAQDVCAMLKVRAHFLPGDIAGVLRSFGLTDTTTLPISNALRSLLSPAVNPSRKMFAQGYEKFFAKLIDEEELDVEFNAKVVSVERKNSQKITVTLEDGETRNFEKVIVATRPSAALQFLADDLEMKALLAQATDNLVHVHAYHTTTGPNAFPSSGPKQFTSVLYPASGLLASATMPQTAFALNKEHDDSSLVIAIGYANTDSSSDDEALRAQQAISSMGYTPTDEVFAKVISYPSTVPASATASGWHAQAAALQGFNDYYFIGETFLGFGVPCVLEETTRVIAQHFLL